MVFLALVAIAHMLKILTSVKVVAGKYYVSMWMSYVAIIVTLVLAVALWNEHGHKNQG